MEAAESHVSREDVFQSPDLQVPLQVFGPSSTPQKG